MAAPQPRRSTNAHGDPWRGLARRPNGGAPDRTTRQGKEKGIGVRLAELSSRTLEERLRKRRSRYRSGSADSPNCLISSMKRSTESKSR